jgi:nucleoside-diphosphate-sugar epimerase
MVRGPGGRMRCLVTGAAGFIGSHLSEALTAEGHFVLGVDSFKDPYPRALKEENLASLRREPRFELREADLVKTDCRELLQEIDWVFHQAAQAGVRQSWGREFRSYTEDNVLATQRLLEACRERMPKGFLYASSSSIYGETEVARTAEDAPPRPVSPYGVSKLAGEHLCYLYLRQFGVPTVILRYFTVYGPRQRPDMAFHRFIAALLDGETLEVYGDGEQTRDFTYVSDVVEANLAASTSGRIGGVYNIGGGERASLNQVLRMLEALAGRPANVRRLQREPGDVRHTWADASRARQEIGFSPRVGLREGLKRQFDWQAGRRRDAHR